MSDVIVPSQQGNQTNIIVSGTLQGVPGDPATNYVTSVAGRQGAIVLTKSDVGLSNVDNTSDLNKPVSTATAAAIASITIPDTTITTITQNGHGFSVGQWVAPDLNKYVLAKADGILPSNGVRIITAVTTNTFTVQNTGVVTGLTNLVPGMTYYLSALTAGLMVGFAPISAAHVVVPLLVATTTTDGIIATQRPTQAANETFLYGINIGNDQVSGGTYQTTQNQNDAAILTKNLPNKRVRVAIPSYNNATGISNMRALTLYYKSLGYFTSYGVTGLRDIPGQTNTAYAAWLAQVDTEAAWASSNGIDRFYIGNEEGNQANVGQYGTKTLSNVITDVKAKAATLKALYPSMEIVYSDAQGTMTGWAAAGLGSLDKWGCNTYDPNFSAYIAYMFNTFGSADRSKIFVSEWSCNQPYKYMVTTGGQTDAQYAAEMALRYDILRNPSSYGISNAPGPIESYFFAFRYGLNGDGTDGWNIFKSDNTYKPGAKEAFAGASGSTYTGGNLVKKTGDTMSGPLVVSNGLTGGQIEAKSSVVSELITDGSVASLVRFQIDNVNKWHMQAVNSGGFTITESSVADRLKIDPGGLLTYIGGLKFTQAGTPGANKYLVSDASGNATWSNITEAQVTNLTSDLANKASLASPAFTGLPTAPTASPGTNTTQLATTAYVATAITNAASTYDDVKEYANFAAFPAVGTADTIYVADDTGYLYRWSGSAYIQVGGGTQADASTSSKGIVQLAGDLAGTATAPTVPALTGKLHNLSATQTQTNDFNAVTNSRYAVDATSGNRIVTLPGTGTLGDLLFIQKTDGTANTVTLSGNINGVSSTTLVLRTQMQGKLMQWDGSTSWNIISGDLNLAALDSRYYSATNLPPAYDPTTDTIHVLKAGDTMTGTLTARSIEPSSTTTYNLGTTNYYSQSRIQRMYLNPTAYLDGATSGVASVMTANTSLNVSSATAATLNIYASGDTGIAISNQGDATSSVGSSLQLKGSANSYLFSFEGRGGFRYYSRVSSSQTFGVGDTGTVTLNDGANIILGTTSGTKFGGGTTQKIGFYGVTPVVQPVATTDLGTVLSSLGLRASGTAYPITTSGTVDIGTGGFKSAPTTRSASVTLTTTSAWNNLCNATTAAFTITLPAASASAGITFWFKKTDSTANAVSISRAGTDTIESATNYTLPTQYKYVELVSDGTSTWYVRTNN